MLASIQRKLIPFLKKKRKKEKKGEKERREKRKERKKEKRKRGGRKKRRKKRSVAGEGGSVRAANAGLKGAEILAVSDGAAHPHAHAPTCTHSTPRPPQPLPKVPGQEHVNLTVC